MTSLLLTTQGPQREAPSPQLYLLSIQTNVDIDDPDAISATFDNIVIACLVTGEVRYGRCVDDFFFD